MRRSTPKEAIISTQKLNDGESIARVSFAHLQDNIHLASVFIEDERLT